MLKVRYGRGKLARLAWIPISVGLALLAAIPAAEAVASPTTRKLEKSLTRQLRKQDLTLTELSGCKKEKRRDLVACSWRATGQLAGGVAYDCEGRARFLIERRRWKGARCKDPMVALLPEPGPHPTFGYNDDWRSQSIATNKLDLLPGAGAQVARQLLVWGWVESLYGTRRWDMYDRLYENMLARGIRPLWIVWGEPCWARPPGSNCFPFELFAPPNPAHFDELADFAAEAAQRYPELAGFEIWNEPNLAAEWGGSPDPAAYGDMLRQVTQAIHAANPSMPVITAGLAPVGKTGAAGVSYPQYLRDVYRTGAPQLADAVGAHPYPLEPYARDFRGSIRAHLFRYLDVMAQFNDATRPIWVTETGVSTVGEGYTPEQQADALVRIYDLFRRIANVPALLFHRFTDQPGQTGVKEEGYGVRTSQGEAKPAYCAVAAARGRPC